MRVLVIEDDGQVRDAVVSALRSAGLAVDEAAGWSQAELNLTINAYDCLVLDRMLADGDSADQLYRLRRRGLAVPALMLTAMDEVRDRIAGFEAGADDYVAKPFSTAELVQRVRALCRRNGATRPTVLRVDDIEVDAARRQVRRAGVLLTVTPKEFSVLEMLMIRDPAVVSRSELIEHCWDEMADPASNVVDVIIAQLRRKLGEPQIITTVRGAGYRLATQGC
ncbi:response regulator transcription factor [Micromonospora sp. Llam7]|uniref:winged helix-turn-helix domain-containing protein n=1 Tax=Micromonospora tarapacensis TaxID=2835305 RepID=UPI001C838C2C|nr:response regulator transcription factor [Micromonospora tarapacensis]MBX7267412.1 response regulator transcription factor [Micromonospora tarapacensis]